MRWFASTVLFVQRLFLGFEPLGKTNDVPLPDAWQPIFIIGAPRSGSTLLFQLLVANYRLAFISNMMALFPRLLSRLARLTRNQVQQVSEIRESDLGYVPGLHAPNEAGAIMRLWFEQSITGSQTSQVRQTVARVSQALGGPMVFKNLNNSLRLDHILSVFPQARMIHLKRDPAFNAQSILRARRKLGIGPDEWWSVEPEGYTDQLGKEEVEQVAWQVRQINAQIESAKARYANNFLELHYEELTASPATALKALSDDLGLVSKSATSSFERVRATDAVRIPEQEWQRLCELLRS